MEGFGIFLEIYLIDVPFFPQENQKTKGVLKPDKNTCLGQICFSRLLGPTSPNLAHNGP